MISYSQNAEDVVLWRAFRDQPTGYYVDIGANHPVWDSVTKHFYDHGWHGINVEPLPARHAELQRDRPRDLNLNLGVADAPGTMSFHEVPSASGLSTFNTSLSDYYVADGREIIEREVDVLTLAEIVDSHVEEAVDFLKVDVEGFEKQVLSSADWSRFRPRAVVVEATYPELWSSTLLDAGYVMVQYDGINNFYVVAEERDGIGARLAVPATVLDAYDPYHYVHQLEKAGEEIIRLRTRVAELEDEQNRRRAKVWAVRARGRALAKRVRDAVSAG
jgi:FkbM family methyltransferase